VGLVPSTAFTFSDLLMVPLFKRDASFCAIKSNSVSRTRPSLSHILCRCFHSVCFYPPPINTLHLGLSVRFGSWDASLSIDDRRGPVLRGFFPPTLLQMVSFSSTNYSKVFSCCFLRVHLSIDMSILILMRTRRPCPSRLRNCFATPPLHR
jgi:hypothetical protein